MSVIEKLEFQPMPITDVFDSMKASQAWYDKSALKNSGEPNYPFVSRTAQKNGIDGFCSRQAKDPESGSAITIALDTQVVKFQPTDFYTSQNIQVLRSNSLNDKNALVLCSLIVQQMEKFSWGGNGATLGRLRKTNIMVPTCTGPAGAISPDWEGMTALGQELFDATHAQGKDALITQISDDDTLPDLHFEPLLLTDLFNLHRGKKPKLGEGDGSVVPYIGAASRENSQVGWVQDEALYPGNWLAIVNTGAGGVGYCTYQPVPFYASNNVTALEPLNEAATPEALIILAATIRHQAFGFFGYGNIANNRRLSALKIMVPTVTDAYGNTSPDWDGMTQYGRSLRVRIERRARDAMDRDHQVNL